MGFRELSRTVTTLRCWEGSMPEEVMEASCPASHTLPCTSLHLTVPELYLLFKPVNISKLAFLNSLSFCSKLSNLRRGLSELSIYSQLIRRWPRTCDQCLKWGQSCGPEASHGTMITSTSQCQNLIELLDTQLVLENWCQRKHPGDSIPGF